MEASITNVSKSSEFPKVNKQITAQTVRLIGHTGDMIGIVPLRKALDMAEEYNLDLVEISPNAEPPVCKITDFGKLKYETKKKAHDAKRKQKVVTTKEIKLRPNIGQNDYEIKLRSMVRFLKDGDKVKITLKFKGREVAHNELGMQLMERIKTDTQETARVEVTPKMEGKQILMVLAPK